MNKVKIVFFIAFLVINTALYQAKSQVSGTWSGTITEHSWFGGQPGVVAETVANISYTRNVGTATFNETGSITADGKVISRTSCTGSGTVGFAAIRIDVENNVYTIQSSALVYHCTYLGAEPDSGELFITIDSVWNGNPRVLKGSKTLITESGGGGKLTTIQTWNLVKDSETELIVKPQKYDTWLPIPGRDEQTAGPEMMTVTLELKDRNGRPASEKAERFELRLNNTSKEKGITLNMPLVPATDQLPDLRFQPQTNAVIKDEGQVMTLFCPTGCLTADIKIACYDGGAWTTLTALAKLETDSIRGKLINPQGEENIRIPKRADGSNIATKWLNENGNPVETDDLEKTAGNQNDGDGLSAYEEYRGVISETEFPNNPTKFGRLDPRKKELGICMKKNNLALFREGVSWLENAASIKIIRLLETEGDTVTRMFNKNFKTANVHKQYFLRLVKEPLPENVGGYTFGPGDYGGPSTTLRTAIDERQLRSAYQTFVADARPHQLKFTLQELIAQTIAHELAHGLNVMHHGVESKEPIQNAYASSIPPYRIFRIGSNVPVTLSSTPFLLEQIGASNSVMSGDLSCLMIFNPYHKWAFSVGADGANIFNEMPMLPMGRRLCTSTAGTGVNAINGYLGNTRPPRGNCFNQINIKL